MKLILLLILLQVASENSLEMADKLRENGLIYVVVIVVAIILIGFFILLYLLDRRVRNLEKNLKK